MLFNKIISAKTLRKVPEIIIFFWIIKLLTTAMGESTSDFLVHHINPVIAVFFGLIGFVIIIILPLLAYKLLRANEVLTFGRRWFWNWKN